MAEQALLGAILSQNRVMDRVGHLLPEHFADPINGRIFAECRKTVESGRLANAITLKLTFENSGILNEVGGTAYLAQLVGAMIGIANAHEYADVIIDAALRRRLIEFGTQVVENAYGGDPELNGAGIVSSGLTEFLEIAGTIRTGRGRTFAQAIDDVLEKAEAAFKGEGLKPLMTGIDTLDAAWGGLWPGLDVLAARSSHGKTVLGMQIVEGVCERLPEGSHVQVFSLEMPNADLALRMFQSRTGVSADTIRKGKIGSVAAILAAARSAMLALPLEIIDTPGLSISDIIMRAKADKTRLGTKLIVIDHLHRIAPPSHMTRGSRLDHVRYISQALKDLSGDLGVPILCLAQLSGEVERRTSHKPRISDIEYLPERDADNIVLLWRPVLYLGDPPEENDFKSAELWANAKTTYWSRHTFWKDKAEAVLAKRRFGPASDVPLVFDETTLKFSDKEPKT